MEKEFLTLVNNRQSCRDFNDLPIDRETLEKIVEIGRLAPSACNSQPWKIHVVHDEQKASEFSSFLRDFGMNGFTKNVTTFIAVSELNAKLAIGSKLKYDNNHFVKYDVGQIIAYITLTAEELGLSTCILGWLNNKKIADFLQFDENEECNVVIAVGYSDIPVREKSRKAIEDISKWH